MTKKVDVNYTTFWNDFSHYSLYEDGTADTSLPLDYRSVIKPEDMLFTDKAKYIERVDPGPIKMMFS